MRSGYAFVPFNKARKLNQTVFVLHCGGQKHIVARAMFCCGLLWAKNLSIYSIHDYTNVNDFHLVPRFKFKSFWAPNQLMKGVVFGLFTIQKLNTYGRWEIILISGSDMCTCPISHQLPKYRFKSGKTNMLLFIQTYFVSFSLSFNELVCFSLFFLYCRDISGLQE